MTYKRFLLVLLAIVAIVIAYHIKNYSFLYSYPGLWVFWFNGVTFSALWNSDDYF